MFDIGMSELLLIGIVALIVVGPKDLPALFHTLGKFTAKMRSLGREFTNAMNEAARESGVDDVAKSLKGVANPKKFGLDKLGEAADRFDKWEPGKSGTPADAPPRAPADAKRAADVEKIRAATEKAGQARLDREAAAKAAGGKDGAGAGTGAGIGAGIGDDAGQGPQTQGPQTQGPQTQGPQTQGPQAGDTSSAGARPQHPAPSKAEDT